MQKSSNTLQYKVGKQRQGSLATIGDKIEETLYSNKVLYAPLTSPASSFKVKIFFTGSLYSGITFLGGVGELELPFPLSKWSKRHRGL